MPPTPRGSPPVGQEEVVVAPALEARVEAGVEWRRRRRAACGESGPRLRERRSTASDRCRRRTSRRRPALDVADVGVHGRHARIARVQHQRHAGRAEAQPSPGSDAAISGRSSPCTSEKFTPAFSNSAAVGEHARAAAAAAGPRPLVLAKLARRRRASSAATMRPAARERTPRRGSSRRRSLRRPRRARPQRLRCRCR